MPKNIVTLSRKSPTLSLYWDHWGTENDSWICNCELKKFFSIPKGVHEINLFASSKEVYGHTYKILEVHHYDSEIEICTSQGTECHSVYFPLFEWIESQQAKGRNHFGVEY